MHIPLKSSGRIRHTLLAAFLLAIACFACELAAAPDANTIVGVWQLPDGKRKVEIYACGAGFCGRIAADDSGQLDARNPNPKKRSAPIMGLEVLWGLRYDGEGKWSGGQYYDTTDGKTYNCFIELASPSRINVQTYVGIAALGRSHTWQR